jgi:hypothetical protein
VNDPPVAAIDQGELDGVLLNWGRTARRIAAANVPEPTSLLAAVAALLGFAPALGARLVAAHSVRGR